MSTNIKDAEYECEKCVECDLELRLWILFKGILLTSVELLIHQQIYWRNSKASIIIKSNVIKT